MSIESAPNLEAPNGERSPIMVMLVDDQAIVGEAVRRLLATQPDIEMHYCADPLDAIDQAVQIKPTVVLLDLVMPRISGMEVVQRFRANSKTANIPIVVLSTTEDAAVKGEAFAAGADDYLVKLPDGIELIARVRYHSRCYLNLLQRDEAYRALRESQLQLLDSNTQLTAMNQAYQKAKDEAEHANSAKSEFLSRMSHELRTPLNAILGFGQLLELDELEAEQFENVEHILRAGHHLLSLINELLDYARVEAGRIALSLEPIQAARVIGDAVDLVRPLAAEYNITLHLPEATESGSFVFADYQRLKQVLINLLSNAVKYNRPGGDIRVLCEPHDPDQLRIGINDTGPGIAPQLMQRLFVPFDRLEADSTRIEGTGLGLALSRGLMEAMGGTLHAHSVVDQGSTFYATLPVVPSPLAELEEEVAAAVVEPLPVLSAPKVVLLIEDNISNLKLVQAILVSRPHLELLAAMQGGIGLDLAQQHKPDLILLDLHLPDMTGREVLDRLKQSPATRDIPVIIVSADATPSQIERLKSAGAVNYLTKPLNVKEFLKTVDDTLAGK